MMKWFTLAALMGFAGMVSCQSAQTPSDAPAGFRKVVFLTLSSEEMYELSLKEGEGALGLVDAFDEAASSFASDPGLPGVVAETSDVRELSIPWGDNQKLEYRRAGGTDEFAVVFYDGVHEPLIIRGVKTADYYRAEARRYFSR